MGIMKGNRICTPTGLRRKVDLHFANQPWSTPTCRSTFFATSKNASATTGPVPLKDLMQDGTSTLVHTLNERVWPSKKMAFSRF